MRFKGQPNTTIVYNGKVIGKTNRHGYFTISDDEILSEFVKRMEHAGYKREEK